MAGGTWTSQNKVRPGIYINYSSSPSTLATMGERGVVCIPRNMSWGESENIITINDPEECFYKLGYDQLSDEMIWLRQLLLGTNRSEGASKVLVWRLGSTGDAAATATQNSFDPAENAHVTVGNLTCTVVEAGVAGNLYKILIREAGGEKFDVSISDSGGGGGSVVFEHLGAETVEDLEDSGGTFTFSGTGVLSKTDDRVPFTGGKDAVINATLTVTAKYSGTRGNDISVVVTPDPDNSASKTIFYVQTLVDGELVDNQILESDSSSVALSGLADNSWVNFTTKTGNAFATSMTLSGGNNGTESSTALSNFLTAAELESWNIVAYCANDAVGKSAVTSFVKRLANDEGKKVQACLWNYPSADNECVISVMPQYITDLSGHTFTADEMVCWVAGASAGASVSQALTYAAHPDAATLNPVLTSSQQIAAINDGQFAFIEEFGEIKNLQDNNTFKTYTTTKGKVFRKNRVIRTVFGIANDTYETFSRFYVGNTNNDDFGRNLLKSELINILNNYQGAGAVKNVNADDVTVSAGQDSDGVVIEENIQPIDSVEKIYINITIS